MIYLLRNLFTLAIMYSINGRYEVCEVSCLKQTSVICTFLFRYLSEGCVRVNNKLGCDMSDEPKKHTCGSPAKTNWLELAKISQQSFFNRRSLEWKLSLGFWTSIAAFTWVFFSVDRITVPSHFSCVLAIGYLLLFALTIPFWHLPLQIAHAGDKRYYLHYIECTKGDCNKGFDKRKSSWEDVNKPWFYGHLVFSLFFLVFSWFVITQVAIPTAKAKASISQSCLHNCPPPNKALNLIRCCCHRSCDCSGS